MFVFCLQLLWLFCMGFGDFGRCFVLLSLWCCGFLFWLCDSWCLIVGVVLVLFFDVFRCLMCWVMLLVNCY